MIESREGIVRLEEEGEENEKLLTDLIKCVYNGQLSIEDEKKVIPWILLAQKYQFVALLSILIDHLVSNMDHENVLQCLHLDLEQDQFRRVKQKMKQEFQTSSDEILAGDTYLTLNVEQWVCALEMLVHKYNELDAVFAVNSWIDFDVENRTRYCYILNSAIKKAVRSNANIKSSEVVFDPQYVGSEAALSEDNKRIHKTGKNGSNCGALGTKCDSFSVRLIKNCTNLMIGMTPRTTNKDLNFKSFGRYFHCLNGSLYSQSSFHGKSYSNQPAYCDGTVIGVSLENGEMSFSINGKDLGVAFRSLGDLDLYPAFDIFDSDCEFQFM